MKMNKRLILAPLAVLGIALTMGVVSTLTGMRLAELNSTSTGMPDQLVGFLVTEGTWSSQTVFQSSADETERVYATNIPEHISEEESTLSDMDPQISFEGIDGPYYFCVVDGEYRTSYADNSVYDSGLNINVANQDETVSESVSVEGSIAVLPSEISDESYFVHPVFQCEDGRVYVIPGHLGINAPMVGMSNSFSISNQSTVTDSGIESSSGNSVTVTIYGKYPPISITILQMDDKNEVIARQTFEPGQLPETLVTEKGTEYLIIEEIATGAEDLPIVDRTLMRRGEEFLLTHFIPDNSKWISAQETTLEWQE
jgi:hypothetical protein